jgi:xanthine dehydrogenase accessory factor
MREVATGAAPLLTTRLSELSASWPAALSLVGTPSGEAVVEPLQPVGPPFYVYGSGLTARALVRMLADLPFATTWLDRAPINFPPTPLPGISTWCGDLVEAVRQVRVGAFHAVMTSDHDLDLAVASAILQRGDFAYLGVIGSRLKRERLLRALAGDGVPERLLSRIDCPIGLPSIRSKNPAVVAVAVVAQALSLSANTAPGEADHATGTNR